MTVDEQLELFIQQIKEIDSIYHNAAVRFGLSDSAFWILLVISDGRNSYTQNELCSEWFYSKQTINSAISSLVKKGYVYLNSDAGNRKVVKLTEEGSAFAERTVLKLLNADRKAFGRIEEEERRMYLEICEKYISFLHEESEKI